MKNLFVLFLFATLIYSCAKDNISKGISPDNQGEMLKPRSLCDSVVITRLLANENYTFIVSACYANGQVTDVDYAIDERESGDKFGVLYLADTTASLVQINLLNNTISSTSSTPIVSDVYSSVGSGTVSWECECNDESATRDDCVKRSYLKKLHYCDGNFCQGCSVILGFTSGGDHHVESSMSAVIVPNNL